MSVQTYVALLPGRSSWPVVCHAEPLGCPHCLEAIAEFLAREMGYDVQAALDRSVGSYRAEVCGERFHGMALRWETVRACFLRRPEFGGLERGTTIEELFVADECQAHARVKTTAMEVAA